MSFWPPYFTYEYANATVRAGWEAHWGTFAGIGLFVTVVIILVIGGMLMWQASPYAAGGFWIAGSLSAGFTWWQIYYAWYNGHWPLVLISLGILVALAAVAIVKGDLEKLGWLAVAGGIVVFVLFGTLWLWPSWYDWLHYPFYWI